ncbi:hypothetical protein [Xanthobacter sp. KR7-225]|uniref:hypothetical protein n=1 Tax=Xanthobacter sp. KR7-225 TaxID=3156613 RepID=UPI0032B4211E
MVDAADRQSSIERLVDMDGGDEAMRASSRAFYATFSDDDLRATVSRRERVERDIARRGSRLAAVWSDTGGEILVTAEHEAAERKARDNVA